MTPRLFMHPPSLRLTVPRSSQKGELPTKILLRLRRVAFAAQAISSPAARLAFGLTPLKNLQDVTAALEADEIFCVAALVGLDAAVG